MTIELYQAHLDRVSRSFAFCIRKLPDPLRHRVSLSYLLCRVLDTVEDSLWPELAVQDRQYSDFERFLEGEASFGEVEAWASRFPATIPEGERLLLADAFRLFEDLDRLDPAARATIREPIRTMRRGMQSYSRRSRGTGLRLSDLGDVNRYCYFVAGVVGELLSRLFTLHRPDFAPAPEFHVNAIHFGLFLQKVNLLKDQRADEREGRFLIPDRDAVLSSLRADGEGAFEYLLSLPLDEPGYRTFCAWSLFLGAASIPWMQKAHAADDGSRIPRSVTQELMDTISLHVADNGFLREGFRAYMESVPLPEVTGSLTRASPVDQEAFQALAGNALGAAEMHRLGMA